MNTNKRSYDDMNDNKKSKKDIEIESVGKFLTTNLKAKIKEEALDLNLLKEKRQAKLPI